MDCFERVVADIGDAQSLEEGLSSFSGHLLACDATLRLSARAPQPPSMLVLFDELDGGTDPAQGAALSQAIVEALLDDASAHEGGASASHTRIAITTHHGRLKRYALREPRLRVAAMEIGDDGAPTFRLLWGAVGESHALGPARRPRRRRTRA